MKKVANKAPTKPQSTSGVKRVSQPLGPTRTPVQQKIDASKKKAPTGSELLGTPNKPRTKNKDLL